MKAKNLIATALLGSQLIIGQISASPVVLPKDEAKKQETIDFLIETLEASRNSRTWDGVTLHSEEFQQIVGEDSVDFTVREDSSVACKVFEVRVAYRVDKTDEDQLPSFDY